VHEVGETLSRDLSNVSLFGQGWDGTVLRRTGDFPLVELTGGREGGDRQKHWTFQNLRLDAGGHGPSDLIHGRYSDGHRFLNVRTYGGGSSGNSIYAEECWDWLFYGCVFSRGGSDDAGTADVRFAKTDEDANSNHFHFLSCRWEKLTSHGIFAEEGGRGGGTRIWLNNCKFHGFPGGGSNETAAASMIAGDIGLLFVANSWFNYTTGSIVATAHPGTYVTNSAFRNYGMGTGQAAIRIGSQAAGIANNTFFGGQDPSPAISVEGGAHPTITGNTMVSDGGVVVRDGHARIRGNVFRDSHGTAIAANAESEVAGNYVENPAETGTLVDGGEVVVTGNRILDAGSAAIDVGAATGGIVSQNFLRDADGAAITAEDASDVVAVGNYDRGCDGIALPAEANELGLNRSV
jgi:hypothetical protein